jgi:hypothetical protein
MIPRCDLVGGLGALAAVGALAIPMRACAGPGDEGHKRSVTRRFDTFELQASATDLLSLRDGLAGFASVEVGPRTDMLWLKGNAGQIWAIGVDSRDLEFKFEVFTLAMETQAALAHRVETAPPVQLPADAPEWMRQWAAQPRVAPMPPETFEPWPLRSWRVDVLRRAEWVIGDLQSPPPTFGDNPVAQNASKPGEVPSDAWAACDVAVGLLFTDPEHRRFLIGVDWLPLNMVVTIDAAAIDEYVAACEAIELATYVQRIGRSQA